MSLSNSGLAGSPHQPASGAGVLVRPRFWDAGTCAALRAAMDAGWQTPAEVYDRGYRVEPGVRRALDIDVDPETLRFVDAAIDAARDEIGGAFGVSVGGHEGPGFLRYLPAGRYRLHQDVLPAWTDEFPRRLSLVLFLTGAAGSATAEPAADECEGGVLRLYPSADAGTPAPIDVAPSRGTLVAFPSTMSHEVLPVIRGVRDVVVDWLY